MFLILYFIFLFFQPIAIVLPHHNLVQSARRDFLKNISQKRFLTRHIILIGPDHFSSNQNQIITSNIDWQLSTGTFVHSQFINLPIDNSRLKNDHAIYNPLADIKTYFPNADVQPILVGTKVTTNNLQSLLSSINSVCKFDCLLIASIDFSHYLPATMAEAHDNYTLDALYNQNLTKIISSEIDSPQSLYLVSKYAFDKNSKFNLFNHTNSGYLTKNPDIETTTHIFGLFNRWSFDKKLYVKTKLEIPYSIDQSKNLNSVGTRFFYGFDEISINSALPDFAIITSASKSKVVQSFFPIVTKDKVTNFIRDKEKTKLIQKYFDSIPDNSKLTKDYFWGKLIYERKN